MDLRRYENEAQQQRVLFAKQQQRWELDFAEQERKFESEIYAATKACERFARQLAEMKQQPKLVSCYYNSISAGTFEKTPLKFKVKGWLRDLTREGVEKNPGPQPRPRRVQSRRRAPRRPRITAGTIQRALAPPGRTYKYVRWAQYANIGTSTTLFINFSWKFALADLPNYTEFTALYDQYRIASVQLVLVANTTESIPSATNNGAMYIVKDFDDANLLASNTDYLQYQNCKVVSPLFHIKKITIAPRVAVATYGGGAFTSYANNAAPWLDVASPSVEHYAIKIGTTATTVQIVYQVMARFSLEFKNPR